MANPTGKNQYSGRGSSKGSTKPKRKIGWPTGPDGKPRSYTAAEMNARNKRK